MKVEYTRWIGFIVINTLSIGLMVHGYCLSLPFLQKEQSAIVLIPVLCIAVVVSAGLFPLVKRFDSHTQRFASLYVGFLVGLLLLGLYMGCWSWFNLSTRPDYHTGIYQAWRTHFSWIPLTLFAGHWFGLPIFFAVGLSNKLFRPLFFPRGEVDPDV